MPRTKLAASVEERRKRSTPERRIATLIFGEAAVQGITQRQLAEMSGMSTSTLERRKKNMKQLTIGEMFTLCEALYISERSLRDALFQMEDK